MAPILFQCVSVIQKLNPAGIATNKRVLSAYHPGHYTPRLLPDHLKPLDTLDYVPPLQYFCLKTLYPNVDSVNMDGIPRFLFHPEIHVAWLKGFIPFFTSNTCDIDMKHVDPRLWGTLIQLYSDLPLCFHTYTLPLSDTHLTQLQAIRSTRDFTLITVLDLSACHELSDETIGDLKPLTNLCVLDLSLTRVGSWGVKKLSMCLVGKHSNRIGPWGVRVWSLRGCRKVDHTVKDALARFPLLSAVDLRGTSVSPCPQLPGFASCPPTAYTTFYYPNPPLSWINGLCESFPDCQIFQSCAMESRHIIHINTLEYPELSPPNHSRERNGDEDRVRGQDTVLALFPGRRQARYTTYQLTQHSQEVGWEANRLSYELQKAKRERERERERCDAFEPYDTNVSGASHRGETGELEYEGCPSESCHSDDDRLWSDLSEETFSEGDYPESDVSELDQGQDDTERIVNPFYRNSSQSQELPVSSRGPEPVAQENEVASIVTTQHAAEQNALRFYRKPDIREWGGSHRPFIEESDPTTDIQNAKGWKEMHKPTPQLPPTGPQWNLMFFREPPAYDSISHDDVPESGRSYRKRSDEPVLAKKRKIWPESVGLPKVLLNRQRATGQGLSIGGGCSQGLKGLGQVAQQTDRESHSNLPCTSMNPFLARMKRPAHSLPSPTLQPISRSQSTKTSRSTVSAVQPGSVSSSQSRSGLRSNTPTPSTTSDMPSTASSSVSCTMHKGKEISDSKGKKQIGKRGVAQMKQDKCKQPFDMRAWAMRTNK